MLKKCGKFMADWCDSSPIAQTPPTYGSQRQNQFYGPGYFNTDFTIMKNTAVPGWERGELGLGVQFFNLFNYPNFDQPNRDINDPSGFRATNGEPVIRRHGAGYESPIPVSHFRHVFPSKRPSIPSRRRNRAVGWLRHCGGISMALPSRGWNLARLKSSRISNLNELAEQEVPISRILHILDYRLDAPPLFVATQSTLAQANDRVVGVMGIWTKPLARRTLPRVRGTAIFSATRFVSLLSG